MSSRLLPTPDYHYGDFSQIGHSFFNNFDHLEPEQMEVLKQMAQEKFIEHMTIACSPVEWTMDHEMGIRNALELLRIIDGWRRSKEFHRKREEEQSDE